MCAFALPVLADPSEDTPAVAEEEVYSPVYDIADPAWPVPPEIAAETAVLMDADTGMILYGKEMHRRMYPASTTKLLTCLIAAERLDLSDTITFSEEAVHSVPADGSKIGMDTGETITVEQALYGIMVGSANEVANAVAEKVSGSMEAFADLMNERAAELGCTDSHFVNAHGYHDDNHYTSAHDLAKIACAFFANDALSVIGNTANYHFAATDTQPDDFYLSNKHQLITGETEFSGILGGKTGYTSAAGETLVTGAQHGDLRLVCVVMKDAPGDQFTDTKTLLTFGTTHFIKMPISEFETDYTVLEEEWYQMGSDLLGDHTAPYSISETDTVLIPAGAAASELTAVKETGGHIRYFYHDTFVGETQLLRNDAAFDRIFRQLPSDTPGSAGDTALSRMITVSTAGTTYLDIRYILLALLTGFAVLSILITLGGFIASFNVFGDSRRMRHRRARAASYTPDERDTVYFHPGRFDDPYDDSDYWQT